MSGRIAETMIRPRLPTPGPNHYMPEEHWHSSDARPQTMRSRTGELMGMKMTQNPSPAHYRPELSLKMDNNMVSGFSPKYGRANKIYNSPAPNNYNVTIKNKFETNIKDISFKGRVKEYDNREPISPQKYSPTIQRFSPDIRFKSRIPQKINTIKPSPQDYVVDFNKIYPTPLAYKTFQKPYNENPSILKKREETPGPGQYETSYRRAIKASSMGVRYNDRVNTY